MSKKNINILWKIMYYLWVLKFEKDKTFNISDEPKIRLLHPLWLIVIIFFAILMGLSEWFFNKSFINELKNNIIIF